MRPVQQNRRMRGRGNNNNRSKGPNPLSRNYESNGPDVKIRGNAQHIAEKYTTLARDAQSSGDRVIAENYLQHAEHYNRIILAAQAQAPVQYQRDDRDDRDDQDEDIGFEDEGNNGNEPERQERQERTERQDRQERQERSDRRDRPERVVHQAINGSGPQPIIEGTPAEVAYDDDTVSQRQAQPQPEVQAVESGSEAAEDVAEAKPRRAPRGRRPARPREPRVADENAAASTAPDTANDLSPASIVAEVKKRRAAVESDV
ncbi:DUF4167 domain-containing protein [Phyllobacterium brassicacearum]|uniref:DUF4167 domain-containing protein n=1 Tax=Phyllobacterium brassicacearum TaxID=314235 RepID=A0A2P7BRY2_9HYPH|nr:DUF4167 domain-containing protein [Phyllobacterium brassicacearum]PSH69225.1 DUF4167 domain-containing protein [Phyllobacterium brassicacearum]TDQ22542.1 uncharacterized protein DUF4167 [Phyllobacterium brassicacearum]